MATVTVPARFNGPPASANGGYSCGVVAAHLQGAAAVSLRRPVPLDEPLEIRHEDHGAARAFADGELIAEAVPAPPLAAWDAPPVSLEEARISHENYAAPADGDFGRCFVCGRARDDGFHIFTGPLAGGAPLDAAERTVADDADPLGDTVASPWTPPAWAADADGAVRPEFVWAALDCPGYFALHGRDGTIAYLARQQVEILAPLRTNVEYVVVGRPLERSGRKGLSATAVLGADGEALAHGECLLVVPRDAPA